MISSGDFVELRARGAVGWVLRELAPLGLDAFWQPLAPLPQAKGRGGVGLLTLGGRELVVRPYRRGGALGALRRDRYASAARARAELQVLDALRYEGVPVVMPIAAVARRSGAFWRLRLCTERLPDALPAPAFLAAQPAHRRAAATAIGTVVQLAFAAGLLHPDLHPDNVLCCLRGDRVRAVLVDLDRARLQRPLRPADRTAMLARMQRYVVRHAGKLAAVPTRAETMRFLRALVADRAARHAVFREVAVRLQRDLRRRLPRR